MKKIHLEVILNLLNAAIERGKPYNFGLIETKKELLKEFGCEASND